MKFRRRSFDSFLSSTLEYSELPYKLEQSEIIDLLEKLDLDEDVSHTIIKGHMRIAMSLVAERATPIWNDDLIGTVFLALTDRVDKIRRKKTRTEVNAEILTPYLVSCMRRRRNDFLSTFPNMTGMPRRTYNYRQNKYGDQFSSTTVNIENVEYMIWPESKRKSVSIEFKEILALSARTDIERQVINLRAQGYTYHEIAPLINCSYRWVNYLNDRIEKRFNLLMGT